MNSCGSLGFYTSGVQRRDGLYWIHESTFFMEFNTTEGIFEHHNLREPLIPWSM